MPRYCIPLALTASLLALAGCDMLFPPYWIAGLTLPAGSTIVNKTERDMSSGGGSSSPGGAPLTMPSFGTADKALMVSFNCSGGWNAVSSHIDTCMQRQGYTDSMQSLAAMGGGYTPSRAKPDLGGGHLVFPTTKQSAMQQMFGGMRMYSKDGSKYSVMLMDTAATLSAAASASGQSVPSSIPGVGQFSLMVYRAK